MTMDAHRPPLPNAQVDAQGIGWVEPYLDDLGIQASTVKLVCAMEGSGGAGGPCGCMPSAATVEGAACC